MRIHLWLTIAVFISTLFWPQLLNDKSIACSLLLFLLLLMLPRLRFLAVIPIAAIYFTFYANLTLTGSLPISAANIRLPFTNAISLQAFVDGQEHSIIVQVNSLINQKNKSYFTAKLLELDSYHLNSTPLLEMRWYNPTFDVQAGQIHHFKVRFKPVHGRANPGGFDRQKWRFSEHIAYQARIKEHLSERSSRISLRAYIYQQVQALSASLDNQSFILALSFADKTLMSIEQKERLQKLAISHLFAISGLHIGLLFSFAYLLVSLMVRYSLPMPYLGWHSWRLVNCSALLVAFFYAYLAGFSLPTQRALLMLMFAVLVLSMKRRASMIDLLTVTLFLILLWDPLAVLSVSLWLSFSAVAIIFLILWRFPSFTLAQKNSVTDSRFLVVKRYFKFLFLIQLSLTLLMMPLQLFHFSALSWLAPVNNFIAVPLFSMVIIPLILLGVLFSLFFPALALFLFSCADALISFFFSLFTAGEGAYQFYSAHYSALIILLISLGLLLFTLYFQARTNQKISAIFAVLMFSLLAISFAEKAYKKDKAWFVEVLDVGQGLAVLIRSEGETLLYDSGPRYPSGFNTATTEIVPYLHELGITRLDYLVISHSDIDHAGGMVVMMEYFNPKLIIMGEPIVNHKQQKFNSVFCQVDQKWPLGALSLTALSPLTQGKNNNNNSCVLKIGDDQHSLLLTGDIEKKQEIKLIAKHGKELASDLLVAPHHGSKHSSTKAFIKAVSPQWVVFTAGFMNHWGFPADEVTLRYKNQSVKMLNSGLSGFIRFKIEKAHIKVQTYREDLASYWYHHPFSI